MRNASNAPHSLQQEDQLRRLLERLDGQRRDRRVLDREDPGCHVRPLDVRAEPQELVRLAARKRRAHHALEAMRPLANTDELPVLRMHHALQAAAGEVEVEPVQLLPHLGRDLIADTACVLARLRDARRDGVRVLRPPEQELADGLRRVLVEVLAVDLVAADEQQQPTPGLVAPRRIRVEERVEVDVHDPADELGTLDVAGRPVQRLGDAAQHQRSTQVSLLPPPCEELTTSEPGRSAARVRPPGTTVTRSPWSTNGRRSMCAGRSVSM